MAAATSDLRLSVQHYHCPFGVLISYPDEGRRLSWPELLYNNGIPANGLPSQ